MFSRYRLFASALAIACVGAQAQQAQPVPPVKPGLWEMQLRTEFDGKRSATLREQIAAMPAAQRESMERKAAAQGAPLDEVVTSRICLPESRLASGKWHVADEKCGVRYESQTATRWAWHVSCPRAESERTADILDAEHYTLDTVTTRDASQGGVRVLHNNATMKWLGADCGATR